MEETHLVLWSVAADGATGNKLVLDGLVHGVVRATQETLKNGMGVGTFYFMREI